MKWFGLRFELGAWVNVATVSDFDGLSPISVADHLPCGLSQICLSTSNNIKYMTQTAAA